MRTTATAWDGAGPPEAPRARRRRRAWLAALLALLLLSSYLLLTPGLEPPDPAAGVPFADKLGHVLLFAALALVSRKAYPDRPAWGVVLALVLYGGAVELAQRDVPGRSAEWLDLVADAVGAAVALVVPPRRPQG